MRPPRPTGGLLLLGLLLAPARASAQDYAPRWDRLERLAAAVEADSIPKQQIEGEARRAVIWAAQRTVRGREARTVARLAIAAGAPFAPPDSLMPLGERFWRAGATRALRSALAADSGDVEAALMLERLFPYPAPWIEPERELAHLCALAARHVALPPELVVAWVGMELERGHPDTAARALDRLGPGDLPDAQRWHLSAQVEFALDDPRAAASYYRGAAKIIDAAGAAPYRRDVAWIADSTELASWDSMRTAGGDAAVWLRRFWQRRDLADLRPPGSRLAEHFARYRTALKDYRWDLEASLAIGVPSVPGAGEEFNKSDADIRFPVSGEFKGSPLSMDYRYRPLSGILDDRGLAVMRHGMPTDVADMPGMTGMYQTLWRYDTPTGPLMLSFSRPGGPGSADPKFGMVARNRPFGDLATACVVDPSLCVLAGVVVAGGRTTAPAERARLGYTQMREIAERTDDHARRFETRLESYAQAYGIPGEGVLLVVAARAEQLPAGRLRSEAIVADPDDGRFAFHGDTTWQGSTSAGPDGYVGAWQLLPVPPGRWQVGVVLSDGAGQRGNGTTVRGVPVADPDRSALQLGDLILGREESGIAWRRFGEQVPLNPTGAWRREEAAVLTLEVVGAVRGDSYGVAIAVRRLDDPADRTRLRIEESLTAERDRFLVQRRIALQQLEPGDYLVEVTITPADGGAAVVRMRALPVRDGVVSPES
ncbi:MAG: hypothetical protein AB7N73_06610 [Gemmatimonadales bacterium]